MPSRKSRTMTPRHSRLSRESRHSRVSRKSRFARRARGSVESGLMGRPRRKAKGDQPGRPTRRTGKQPARLWGTRAKKSR